MADSGRGLGSNIPIKIIFKQIKSAELKIKNLI
jgi:hypothetical protein